MLSKRGAEFIALNQEAFFPFVCLFRLKVNVMKGKKTFLLHPVEETFTPSSEVNSSRGGGLSVAWHGIFY
jgi:hypothetical protein